MSGEVQAVVIQQNVACQSKEPFPLSQVAVQAMEEKGAEERRSFAGSPSSSAPSWSLSSSRRSASQPSSVKPGSGARLCSSRQWSQLRLQQSRCSG